MTEILLDGQPSLDNVLEIGTGCGYQTVILSRFARQVSTLERIDALLAKARERFYSLGCRNIRARNGDGNLGWPEHAPFDGILVAAAPVGIPERLLEQLAAGGRLVIPVGKTGRQELLRVRRTDSGFEETRLDPVSFVPMMEGLG